MAFVSVTYNFSNGSTASASQVNNNFSDIVNALSDGTVDMSFNKLTLASNATFLTSVAEFRVWSPGTRLYGAVTDLGYDSTSRLNFQGRIFGNVVPEITAYGTSADDKSLGASTKGWQYLYMEHNTAATKRVGLTVQSGLATSYTAYLPAAVPVTDGVMTINSSGVGTWRPYTSALYAVASANYAILPADGYRHIVVTTGASNRTITLPAVATAIDRVITVKKADSGVGYVVVTRNSADTIDGATTYTLTAQYDAVDLVCDGTNWHRIGEGSKPDSMIRLQAQASAGHGSTNTKIRRFISGSTPGAEVMSSVGADITYATSDAAGASFTINRAGVYAIHYSDAYSSGAAYYGLSLNADATQRTTNITDNAGVPGTVRIGITCTTAANNPGCVSTTLKLAAGDVIRMHDEGQMNTAGYTGAFTITQVAKL